MTAIPEALSRDVLSLSDEEFHTVPREDLDLKPRLAAAAREDFVGLALACPAEVSSLAFPILRVCSMGSDWLEAHKPGQSELVVVTPLGRGAISHGRSLPPPRPDKNPAKPRRRPSFLPPRRPPAEPEEPLDARLTSVTLEDVCERVALPPTGSVGVRLVSWDLVSNTVVTSVRRPDPDEPAPFPGYYLEDGAGVQAAVDFGRLAAWRERPASAPRVEGDDEGAAFRLPSSWRAGEGSVTVAITARARAREDFLVAPVLRVPDQADWLSQRDPETFPVAILTGALFVVRAQGLRPSVLPLTLPVYSEDPVAPGAVLEGWTAVNLAKLDLEPGSYCVYLVMGALTAGPRAVTVTPS